MMIDTHFINQKLCQENGYIADPDSQESSKEFIEENKKYYQNIENYDWVKVADDFRGLEAILHRLREKSLLEKQMDNEKKKHPQSKKTREKIGAAIKKRRKT